MKEIHFHLSLATTTDLELCTTYLDTMFALKNKTPVIHTTCIEFLSTGLFQQDYRVFIHFLSGASLELKLGYITPNGRLLRPENDLKHLLLAGEFGRIDET